MRFMSRKPDCLALGILNGHNCLVSGTYKYSLGEYMSAFKQDRNNPLIALMLGLTFTHMACQKFSARKHRYEFTAVLLNRALKRSKLVGLIGIWWIRILEDSIHLINTIDKLHRAGHLLSIVTSSLQLLCVKTQNTCFETCQREHHQHLSVQWSFTA